MTIHRSQERLFRRLARAIAIGGVAFSLAPATADARPERGARDTAAQEQSTHWGTATLAGGAVALLVVGALGVAAADDRRYLSTSS
ncbi:hypothetical protein [Solirubrobacter soli]|uniref:hypothetical protein n=1 Tax=Solirubrobacter soli TaxID=363832 RepID=UPI0003FD7C8C|nr:hypothetical protein [Solirubrobacter soli]